MAVGGLGVSGGIDNSTLLLMSVTCCSAAPLLSFSNRSCSVRGRRGAVSLCQPLLAGFLRPAPGGGIPNLDVVVEPGDDHVALQSGELPQARRNGDTALAVGCRLGRAGKERSLH